MSDPRRIDYVPLSDLRPNPANVKDHDLGLLHQSLSRFGVADLPVIDGRTGLLVSGHGRTDALGLLATEGAAPPDGIRVADDGTWLVPAVVGWRSANDRQAEAYLVAANATVEAGGWNDTALVESLERLAAADRLTGVGFDGDDVDGLRWRLDNPIEVEGHKRQRKSSDLWDAEPLADTFGVSPLSTLNADGAPWTEFAESRGLSGWRHVLAALAAVWFAPPGGTVLVPDGYGQAVGTVGRTPTTAWEGRPDAAVVFGPSLVPPVADGGFVLWALPDAPAFAEVTASVRVAGWQVWADGILDRAVPPDDGDPPLGITPACHHLLLARAPGGPARAGDQLGDVQMGTAP